MGKIIGIDLGTTYSLVSYIDESGRVRLIPNVEGQYLTPSVVLIKKGTIRVGQVALDQVVIEREYVVRGIKRSMGDDTFTFQGLTPTQISAEILKKLKRDAEAELRGEVDEAVITVPAYFTDKPRTATKQAGELAGFSVKDLPNEPTAAALYYGTAQMKDGDCILVYDLGGGTMDATVLKYENDTFNVLASDGSQSLGGQDWTQRIVDFVSDAYEAAFGLFPASDRRIEQMVFDECEKAKRMLATVDAVSIPLSHEGKVEVVSISLQQFEEMTADLLLQTTTKVESALSKAGVDWKYISRILLVGGSTRLRMVERALKEVSGITPTKYRNPDELVALGAALYTRQEITKDGRRQIAIAQQTSRGIVLAQPGSRGIVIFLKESTTHGLGTVVIDRSEKTPRLVTSVIIPPQTQIPASESREDYETLPHQTEIDIPVVEADKDGLDPYSCHINKTYRFLGVPDRDRPSQIRVSFYYDKDAIINVSAMDVESQQHLEKKVIDFELPEVVAIPANYDEFGNPKGKAYDLGSFDDQRLAGERILLYIAYVSSFEKVESHHVVNAVAERNLKMDVAIRGAKGWTLSESELSKYTQLWYLSDKTVWLKPKQVQMIKAFNEAGNGLLIWADNEPYYADANLLAQAIVGTTFSGNEMADKILEPGTKLKPGVFIEHPLTSGLNSLYEGITICTVNPATGVTILAQSHDGQSCMACFERGQQRVVLDTGFTKIIDGRFNRTAGTGRYFRNIAFWLACGARDSVYKLLTPPERLATIKQGKTSKDYSYDLKTSSTLSYILSWEGAGELELEIEQPSGAIYTNLQSKESPIQLEITNAQPGVWRCRVHGAKVSGADLPYVLTVVERKQTAATVQSTLISSRKKT